MVEKVAQHRHCQNCDKAIPYKDKFCDEKCESGYEVNVRSKKKQLTYFYVAMVAIFVMAMALLFLG